MKNDNKQIPVNIPVEKLCPFEGHPYKVLDDDVVKRYTEIKELTPQIFREFVSKIIVHHRQRIDGVDVQKIEIVYNCIGAIDFPDLELIPTMM